MACRQLEDLLSHYNEPPSSLQGLKPSVSVSPRSSWNCVMDVDGEHEQHDDCTMSSRKKKPRRSVSFRQKSTLFCYDVPEDEPQDWYSSEDDDIFKAKARKELAVFRRLKGEFADSSGQLAISTQQHHQDLCVVGIEQHLISPEFSRKRAMTKKLVKCVVLLEQSKISKGNGENAERIAEASRRYSEWSAIQAKMVGDFQSTQGIQMNKEEFQPENLAKH